MSARESRMWIPPLRRSHSFRGSRTHRNPMKCHCREGPPWFRREDRKWEASSIIELLQRTRESPSVGCLEFCIALWQERSPANQLAQDSLSLPRTSCKPHLFACL
jgi:hypothetical protein